MAFFILSFIAGVLTIAAPCVLPLLPVIIGGSILETSKEKSERHWIRPLVIASSLSVSVVIFTLLLKSTTTLLGVPQYIWQLISGVIVLLLGAYYLWPNGWEEFSAKSGLFNHSNQALGKAYQKKGLSGAILIGAALGPVFSSCSPTYALIVAVVIPASFIEGSLYLVAYALGMGTALLLVAYIGQAFVSKLRWLSSPNGWFRRLVGVLFILVGLVVIFDLDKQLQTFVLEQGWYDPISNFEQNLSK